MFCLSVLSETRKLAERRKGETTGRHGDGLESYDNPYRPDLRTRTRSSLSLYPSSYFINYRQVDTMTKKLNKGGRRHSMRNETHSPGFLEQKVTDDM